MDKPINLSDYYCQYFRDFRDKAPKEYLTYGGYFTGLPNAQASSFESCEAFVRMIGEKETLLNAGAGASSWIFRKLLKNVYCTDPDKGYLEAVKYVVGGDNYIHTIDKCPEVDYVYWDYGNAERVPNLSKAYSLARKAMYVDDCHDVYLADCVRKLGVETNSKVVGPVGLDSHGRFGLVLIRL
jgi:hypothetical protein